MKSVSPSSSPDDLKRAYHLLGECARTWLPTYGSLEQRAAVAPLYQVLIKAAHGDHATKALQSSKPADSPQNAMRLSDFDGEQDSDGVSTASDDEEIF